MAIALVGIPYAGHSAQQWAEENLWQPSATNISNNNQLPYTMQLPNPSRDSRPLYPGIELDDVVLHFRCGDLIESNHPSFGFMKFESYSRHLLPNVTSIGIVTQPLNGDGTAQLRLRDRGKRRRERCIIVVHAFVEHLQTHFPAARVSIRNNANETIALTFARMIMAKQTVVGITTFGVFPAVATFGMAYIRRPDFLRCPNRWLLRPDVETIVDNVKLIDEPRLMAVQCKRLWGNDGALVLQWFQDYTMTL